MDLALEICDTLAHDLVIPANDVDVCSYHSSRRRFTDGVNDSMRHFSAGGGGKVHSCRVGSSQSQYRIL